MYLEVSELTSVLNYNLRGFSPLWCTPPSSSLILIHTCLHFVNVLNNLMFGHAVLHVIITSPW